SHVYPVFVLPDIDPERFHALPEPDVLLHQHVTYPCLVIKVKNQTAMMLVIISGPEGFGIVIVNHCRRVLIITTAKMFGPRTCLARKIIFENAVAYRFETPKRSNVIFVKLPATVRGYVK